MAHADFLRRTQMIPSVAWPGYHPDPGASAQDEPTAGILNTAAFMETCRARTRVTPQPFATRTVRPRSP